MINLTLTQKYLHLKPFTIELPNFTIITGLNGSGKTQLLKAIKSKIASNDVTIENNLIHLLDQNSFNLQSTQHISEEDDAYQHLFQSYKDLEHMTDESYKAIKDRILRISERIAKFANKDSSVLTIDDFKEYYPINNSLHGVFNSNFFAICFRYAQKYEENNKREYLNTFKKRTEISYFSNERFIEIYGEAPWIYIDKVFQMLNISYHIEISEVSSSEEFSVFFVNNISGAKISFQGLSSGEQVIVSTALSIYNLEQDSDFPKIILMDEPDASLHPSMIKHFLKVVEIFSLRKKG